MLHEVPDEAPEPQGRRSLAQAPHVARVEQDAQPVGRAHENDPARPPFLFKGRRPGQAARGRGEVVYGVHAGPCRVPVFLSDIKNLRSTRVEDRRRKENEAVDEGAELHA